MMQNYSKLLRVAVGGTVITATAWLMYGWERTSPRSYHLEDRAYLRTAYLERAALAGLIGPPEDATVWTNTLPLYLNRYSSPSPTDELQELYRSVPDDEWVGGALRRWIAPPAWPDDGTPIALPSLNDAPYHGTITNISGYVTNLTRFVTANVPAAAANLYPRLYWVRSTSSSHAPYIVERSFMGEHTHYLSGNPSQTNTANRSAANTAVINAITVANTNVTESTFFLTSFSAASFNLYYGGSGGLNARTSADLSFSSIGQTGTVRRVYFSPQLHPLLYASDSPQRIVGRAWVPVSLEAGVSYSSSDLDALPLTDLESMALTWGRNQAGKGAIEMQVSSTNGTATAYATWLEPLTPTDPEDDYYPAWYLTFPSPRNPLDLFPLPLVATANWPRNWSMYTVPAPDLWDTEGHWQVYATLQHSGIILEGDFETYLPDETTWDDVDYYDARIQP